MITSEWQGAGYLDQHRRDSEELRRLCADRDAIKAERDTLRAQLEAAEAEVANLRTANIAYSQQVNELIGRAGNAEARAEAAEANAARYEWLRGAEGLNLGLLDLVDEELDAAIDAAMSRTKEETNHE